LFRPSHGSPVKYEEIGVLPRLKAADTVFDLEDRCRIRRHRLKGALFRQAFPNRNDDKTA
jgi:hypothetical protein